MEYIFILLGFGLLIYAFNMKSNKTVAVALQPVTDLNNFQPFAMILDTETTGLIRDNSIRVTKNNVQEFSDNFPRLVQLSFILIDKKGNYDGKSFYIKQKETIPEEAFRIHGITNELCEKEGVELEKALSELSIAVSKVDNIVGHNIAFDYKVLHSEFTKAGIPYSLKKKNKIDTMKLTGKHLGHKYGYKISLYNAADKLFGNKREWQSIKPQLKQHNAESDVIVTALIFNMLYNK
jgi:DNA polymerase III epsilon subunit-like protein